MSTMASPMLTAHFLGTFRVTVDGALVDTVSSRRTRSVLAYLLAHRRTPVPRDVLMEVFWPAAEPNSARNSLHVAPSSATSMSSIGLALEPLSVDRLKCASSRFPFTVAGGGGHLTSEQPRAKLKQRQTRLQRRDYPT